MSQVYTNENIYVFLHSSREKSLYYDIDTLSTEFEVLVDEEEESSLGESLPYLIHIDLNDPILVQLLENKLLMKDAFFIKSTESIEVLADRFRPLFKLKNKTDEEYYFTFYVAEIFKMFLYYLKIHRPSFLHRLLENIDVIYLPKHTKDNDEKLLYYTYKRIETILEGISFSNDNDSVELLYDKTMHDCFSNYRTNEFVVNLYDELRTEYPTRPKSTEDRADTIRWFYEIIKEAKGYEVTEEESVANLIKASWLLNESVVVLNESTKKYLADDELSAYHKSEDLLNQTLKAYERGQNA